ncbi:MAG: prenyltransferase [Candidatus Promineifilaceae bacterium]
MNSDHFPIKLFNEISILGGLLDYQCVMKVYQTANFYFRMSRPSQLLLIAAVYGWGVLVALTLPGSQIDPMLIMAGLPPLLFVSASIHYANEHADYETDALTLRTRYSGGSGAMQDLHASPETALKAAWLSLIIGISVAVFFVASGLLPLVTFPILILGAFGGWMYSLRPLALAWRGWGEATNAFLGGMLLPVFGYAVLSARIDWRIILLTLPFALFAFDNLLATTWPDRSADRQVGKFTLATLWSTGRLRTLYFLTWLGAFQVLILIHGRILPTPIFWASLLILPAVVWSDRTYTRQHSPFPSVLVMVLFLVIQIAGWSVMVAYPSVFNASG